MTRVEMARPAFEHAAALLKNRLSTPHVRKENLRSTLPRRPRALTSLNTPDDAADDSHFYDDRQ